MRKRRPSHAKCANEEPAPSLSRGSLHSDCSAKFTFLPRTAARRFIPARYKLSSRPELPIPEGDAKRSGGTCCLLRATNCHHCKLSSLQIVIPTGASHPQRGCEAEWRDLLSPASDSENSRSSVTHLSPSFGLSGAVPPLGTGCQTRNGGSSRRSRSESARALGTFRPQSTRLLSPRWGSSVLVFPFPTASAVGCILTPLRG